MSTSRGAFSSSHASRAAHVRGGAIAMHDRSTRPAVAVITAARRPPTDGSPPPLVVGPALRLPGAGVEERRVDDRPTVATADRDAGDG
jgi:hypothetical protein